MLRMLAKFVRLLALRWEAVTFDKPRPLPDVSDTTQTMPRNSHATHKSVQVSTACTRGFTCQLSVAANLQLAIETLRGPQEYFRKQAVYLQKLYESPSSCPSRSYTRRTSPAESTLYQLLQAGGSLGRPAWAPCHVQNGRHLPEKKSMYLLSTFISGSKPPDL